MDENEFTYNIHFNEFDVNKGPFKKNYEFGFIQGRFFSTRGALDFELIDTVEGRTIMGQFIDCPDTLKQLVHLIDPVDFEKQWIVVDTYFQPLESGKWTYINQRREDTFSVYYQDGIIKG